MWNEGAIQRWIGVGRVSRAHAEARCTDRARRWVGAMLVLVAGVFAGPVAAQSTAVSIAGADRPSFSRAGQALTFRVQLDAGNVADIDGLSFTSGSPAGMSPVSCPTFPELMGSTTCTFTYTTTDMDVAMGKVTALGRWRATRSSGAARNGTTNTFTLSYAPPRQPDAPVVTTVVAGDAQAVVSFAPQFDGGYPIDNYTVTSQPQGLTASGANGPITVTGLTNGVSYRFTVAATSTMGASAASSPSANVVPQAAQTISFSNPGVQTFGTTPTLTATATSHLTPVFSSGSPSNCTITAGGALTFLTAGTCTIHADQGGDAAFEPAPRVSHSFQVNAILPDAPTIGTAIAGDAEATVSFTAPASNGGAAIDTYTATANPGGITGTSSGSPIRVSGLTNGVGYTFTVTARNQAGTGAASAASNSVTPGTAPLVTSVAVPASATYEPGQALDFTVSFDQTVSVTGTPRIALVIGSTTVQADYVSGSGTSTLQFRYTVLPGQLDLDGIAVGALSLNGGSLRSLYGIDAVTTLNSVGSTAGVLVAAFNQAPVNQVPGRFSIIENSVHDFGNTLSISDADAGSATLQVAIEVGDGTFSLSRTTGLAFSAGTGTNDRLAEFTGTLSDINAALSGLKFTPPTGFVGLTQLEIRTSDLGNTGMGGEKTDNDTVPITVVALDSTAPTVTSIDLVGATPTQATALSYVVTFSEPVINVFASAFTLTTTGSANGSISLVSTNDHVRYTVTVTGASGDGTLRLDLRDGAVSDTASNLAPAFISGPVYTLDHTAPTIDSLSVSAAGQYTAGQTIVFSLHFNEPVLVAGTPSLPFALDVGGSRDAVYTGGSGTNVLVFAYTVAAGDQDLDGPTLGSAIALNGGDITDLVGNAAPTALGNLGNTSGVVIGQFLQAITGFTATPGEPTFAPNGTFTVTATGGASGQPVVFASTSPAVCSVSGNVVTMLAAGTCALTADQAGTNGYVAATQVALQVVIARATPTLSWVDEMSRVVGEASFDLPDPSSDSRGAFTFSSTNTAVATVSGRRVTVVGAGVTTLVATQAADGNYTQATISATLTVTDRPDPTKDASVVGSLEAQVDASVRFAAAQLSNIQGRLREQRTATVNRSSNDLTFAMASRSGGAVSMSAEQLASMETAHLPKGLAIWTAGAITTGGRDADSRGSDFDFQSDGVTVGADWRFSDRAVLGVAGGWGWNDTDLDDARSRLDAQQRALSIYGLWRPSQRWFVDGILGWGDLDFDIRRHSDVANATATATRGGDQAFGALTAGYEHGGGVGMTLTGYGRLDASRTTLDAYREQGLGLYDLAYGSQRVDNSGASLGVEGSFPILTPRGAAFRPYWMLEYREALENRSNVDLNYVVLPVDGGYVLGMRGYGDNALTYGAGMDMELARGWKLSVLGRRQHADGLRPSSTFGLMISWAPAAQGASATALREDPAQTGQPQDAEAPAQP